MFRASAKRSVKDLCTLANKEWPTGADSYELQEDCGRGVSATVFRARCLDESHRDVLVAVKVLSLEAQVANLDEIVHEAQVMKGYNHPNVLPLFTSFVNGTDLWLVMPYVSGGSVLHIIKYSHPEVGCMPCQAMWSVGMHRAAGGHARRKKGMQGTLDSYLP